MKRRAAVTLLLGLMLSLAGVAPVQASALPRQAESEHFILYALETEASTHQVLAALEANYVRICADLGTSLAEKTEVEVYPDLNSYHAAVGWPEAPDWLVGNAGPSFIKIVSPFNPGPAHTCESLMQAVVHEFTHTVIKAATGDAGRLPKWLNEGVAAYEAGQMTPTYRRRVMRAVTTGRIPRLQDFEVDTTTFADRGGFPFSYTMVEFLIDQFGWERLRSFVREPDRFEAIYGRSKDELSAEWAHFLTANYGG